MTSKEALELLELILNNHSIMLEVDDNRMECINTIKQALESLEALEKENEKLKKALKMACERLSWDCPCSQDLIDDLDCENRCQPDIDYAECWKKYFLKEVVNNESNNT